MAKGETFVFFALARWDGYGSTAFSIAKELSKENKVYYIDNPLTLSDVTKLKSPSIRKRLSAKLFENSKKKLGAQLTILYPPWVLPINGLKNGNLYKRLNSFNSKLVFKWIERQLQKRGVTHYILFNSFNPFYSHNGWLSPKLYIYQTVDNIEEAAYIKKHGPRLERTEVSKADIVLTTAIKLKEKYINLNSSIYHLPNAANNELFKVDPGYDSCDSNIVELAQESNIIIYTGHLDRRVDTALLTRTIKKLPNYTFLFIGLNSLNEGQMNDLNSFANVRFIGHMPLDQLVAYLYLSRCAIIPFLKNELTSCIYPLKINEYLSVGLPVVSTAFSADINLFEQIISISDKDGFASAIESEIKMDTNEKKARRRDTAASNTWQNRITQFYQILSGYL